MKRKVELCTVADGLAVELFDKGMAEILDDIRDKASSDIAQRTLTLKIKVQPSKERQKATITISSDVSLPKRDNSEEACVFLKDDGRKLVAVETNDRELFDRHGEPKVTKIHDRKAAAANDKPED